jgi:hypothetical protein
MWSPALVELVIALAVGLVAAGVSHATLKDDEHPIFWGLLLFLFSATQAWLIARTLEAPESVIVPIQSHFDERFKYLAEASKITEYALASAHEQPFLEKWTEEAVEHLDDDLSKGLVPIPWNVAPEEIGRLYEMAWQDNSATPSIVATNVGSTDLYFSDHNYESFNKEASQHHVPVVRFFLYRKGWHVKLSGGQNIVIDDKNEQSFIKEVNRLNSSFESLCSVWVDLADVRVSQDRDLLLVNNEILAETKLLADLTPIEAVATAKEERLDEARDYFKLLMGHVTDSNMVCTNDDVTTRFPLYKKQIGSRSNAEAARVVYRAVMRQVTGM